MEAKIYNQIGKEAGTIALPENVFGVNWNADLVHQVLVSSLSNVRHAIAHTKTRGEVRGGGKKPWKQKGTGRARHGSTRSPIWVGGGVAHGPRSDKNFDRKVNRKMKAKALYTILSKKYKDGEILFVDSLSLKETKTKDAREILTTLGGIEGYTALATKRNNAAYIALPGKDSVVEKSFRNFGNISVNEMRNMNPVEVLNYKYIVIADPKASLPFLASKLEATEKKVKTVKSRKAPAVKVPKVAKKAKAAKK